MSNLIVDSFAGGGGASTGIEMALGRSPDFAINHDADALRMHATNHPDTEHLCSNIYTVDPRAHVKRDDVALAWFSPDCKHFSKAKGSAPVKRNIRDLAWVVVQWAERVRPRVIMLENVEEFLTWGPVDVNTNKPIAERAGETWKQWVAALRRQGYSVQWRQLRACDYGAPTIRKRLFVIARCDREPIVWPEPTHGAPDSPQVLSGKLKPWRTAAEIIDWSLPCPSIFLTKEEGRAAGVKRPLVEATMRRIAKGVKRYVLDAAEPFIVTCNHAGEGFRGQPMDSPLSTVTAARDATGVVMPSFVISTANTGTTGRAPYNWSRDEPLRTITSTNAFAAVMPAFATYAQHGGNNRDLRDPLHTVTASTKDYNGIVVPHLQAYYGEGNGGQDRSADVLDPLKTVTTENRHALIAPHLMTMRNSGKPHQGANEPTHTVTAGGAHQFMVSAFLAQHNAGPRPGRPGRPATDPVSTLTATGSQQSVVASHMISMHGADRRSTGADAPLSTITAGGQHAGMVAAFLQKYYGNEQDGVEIDAPLHTVTTKDRFSLVTVEIGGTPYALVDIGMRMLTPRELYRAQGFPDIYQIERDADGKPFTKTAQIRMVGNSVCPALAEALVRANASWLIDGRKVA
ncbi:MAG: DNA cytosine methyltransferase [Pseudomonadota bacterium]